MRVLVIGSGAREHALLLALRNDPDVESLAIAPGNAGTAAIADQHEVDITSGDDVVALAQKIGADLVVIGPEVPLVLGVADAVRAAGHRVLRADEGGRPHRGLEVVRQGRDVRGGCSHREERDRRQPAHLDAALDRFGPGAGDAAWVVKDDGLAAGKGVVVTTDRDAARAHAASLLDAGHPVLLESFLDGPEVSLFCVVDGETVVPLLPAQDFKRVGDGDTGPNTGGMGAYAPVPWLPDDVTDADRQRHRETRCRGAWFDGTARSRGCCTPGWRSRRTDPRWSNSTAASAIPRRSRCWRCIESPLGQLLHAAATGRLAEQPALRLA